MLKRIVQLILLLLILAGAGAWGAYARLQAHEITLDEVELKQSIIKDYEVVGSRPVTVDAGLFWTVWDKARAALGDGVSDDDLLYGAVNGLLRFGFDDPYSSFLPPQQSSIEHENIKGEYGGIGAQLEYVGSELTVVAPFDDAPAARAGIRPGDKITAIDGESTESITVLDAVEKLRGNADTEVTVQVSSGDPANPELREVTLTRETIDLPSVTGTLGEDGVLLMRIRNFALDTAEEWDEILSGFELPQVQAVVLDLRNNSGGVVDEVPLILGDFLDSGLAFSQVYSLAPPKTYPISGQQRLLDTPLAILTNQGSASATEMLVAALQESGRGRVFGEHTFGKSAIQQILDIPVAGADYPASLRLVIGRWQTPSGQVISDQGLEPDVEVRESLHTEEDDALAAALEWLRSQ